MSDKTNEPSKKSSKTSDQTSEAFENENNESRADENQPEQSLSEMAKALTAAQSKAAENMDLYLRARADIENTQRRARIDIENAHKYAIERFAKDMLTVIDSLEQGLQVADSVKDEAYHQGLELTLKVCLDTFEKYGIRAINPLGEPFDPKQHEALTTQVSKDQEPNRVTSVIQKGFILNDRVLRPARVIVSRRE